MDSSLLFATDVGAVWAGFDSFTPTTLLKLKLPDARAVTQSPNSHEGDRIIVMLMDLAVMRHDNVWSRILAATSAYKKSDSSILVPATLLRRAITIEPSHFQRLHATWSLTNGRLATGPTRECRIRAVQWVCNDDDASKLGSAVRMADNAFATTYSNESSLAFLGVIRSGFIARPRKKLSGEGHVHHRPYDISELANSMDRITHANAVCPASAGGNNPCPLATILCKLDWELVNGLTASPCTLRTTVACARHVKEGSFLAASTISTKLSGVQDGRLDPDLMGRRLSKESRPDVLRNLGRRARSNFIDCLVRKNGSHTCAESIAFESVQSLEHRIRLARAHKVH